MLITDFPTVSDDGLTYSFELKQGVHFTNGTELTSKDVKFTFERCLLRLLQQRALLTST